MRNEQDRVICSSYLTKERHKELMRNAEPMDYNELKGIVKAELPNLYEQLCLSFPNPYGSNSKQTKTHYILSHSMKEYFIKK